MSLLNYKKEKRKSLRSTVLFYCSQTQYYFIMLKQRKSLPQSGFEYRVLSRKTICRLLSRQTPHSVFHPDSRHLKVCKKYGLCLVFQPTSRCLLIGRNNASCVTSDIFRVRTLFQKQFSRTFPGFRLIFPGLQNSH